MKKFYFRKTQKRKEHAKNEARQKEEILKQQTKTQKGRVAQQMHNKQRTGIDMRPDMKGKWQPARDGALGRKGIMQQQGKDIEEAIQHIPKLNIDGQQKSVNSQREHKSGTPEANSMAQFWQKLKTETPRAGNNATHYVEIGKSREEIEQQKVQIAHEELQLGDTAQRLNRRIAYANNLNQITLRQVKRREAERRDYRGREEILRDQRMIESRHPIAIPRAGNNATHYVEIGKSREEILRDQRMIESRHPIETPRAGNNATHYVEIGKSREEILRDQRMIESRHPIAIPRAGNNATHYVEIGKSREEIEQQKVQIAHEETPSGNTAQHLNRRIAYANNSNHTTLRQVKRREAERRDYRGRAEILRDQRMIESRHPIAIPRAGNNATHYVEIGKSREEIAQQKVQIAHEETPSGNTAQHLNRRIAYANNSNHTTLRQVKRRETERRDYRGREKVSLIPQYERKQWKEGQCENSIDSVSWQI